MTISVKYRNKYNSSFIQILCKVFFMLHIFKRRLKAKKVPSALESGGKNYFN